MNASGGSIAETQERKTSLLKGYIVLLQEELKTIRSTVWEIEGEFIGHTSQDHAKEPQPEMAADLPPGLLEAMNRDVEECLGVARDIQDSVNALRSM